MDPSTHLTRFDSATPWHDRKRLWWLLSPLLPLMGNCVPAQCRGDITRANLHPPGRDALLARYGGPIA